MATRVQQIRATSRAEAADFIGSGNTDGTSFVVQRDALFWAKGTDPAGDTIWGRGATFDAALADLAQAMADAAAFADDDPLPDWQRANG